MSSISSLARSAVDIVQERIKIQSGKLTKHIEALLGVHRPPPASQSVVGDMNPTTAICQPLGLPLGNEHPGTTLRRSERLAARRCDHGATAEGAEPPEHGWDLYTGESFTTQILDQPPRPRAYSERGMDVTIFLGLKSSFQRCIAMESGSCIQKSWSRKTIIFIRKIVFFETLALWRGQKTLIFLKTFFVVFEYLHVHVPLGKFKSQLLIKGPTFVFFTNACIVQFVVIMKRFIHQIYFLLS